MALGRRLLWLFLLPFVITAAIIPAFFVLNSRLSDVELSSRIVTIERLLLSDKNYAWAIDQYEQIAQFKPSAQLLARLGVLYFLQDPTNERKAIEKLDDAKQYDQNYWEIYRSLTFIYTQTRETKEAIEAGERAIKLNKYDANTLNNMAWILATCDKENRDLQKAEQYGLRAVNLTHERNAQFMDTLGVVYGKKGDLDNARLYFRRAIVLANSSEIQSVQTHFNSIFPTETLPNPMENNR